MNNSLAGRKLWIRGIVQGVGFRPYIYSLADRFQLSGWVRNTSSGVEIEVNGSPDQLERFLTALPVELPPLARIDSLQVDAVPPNGYATFEILFSRAVDGEFIPISPDVSICPACQAELFDPSNRRYRYPFINCTHCGPRFSIIQNIPYDRPNTTMSGFPLCPQCAREYHDPSDRRFHAQPTACPKCGPQVSLRFASQTSITGDSAVRLARQLLKQGKILAVKGLGGFHLACDAANNDAVNLLRQRKKRSDKAFALMAFDLQSVQRHAAVSAAERDLLLSRQRPVVLLQRLQGSPVAPEVAPNQPTLGFMLAYTPLHLLLLEPEPGFPDVLVMTSGNRSDEPIAYTDVDALDRLSGIADAFLTHNRDIHMRVDDSVARVIDQKPYLIRRSRGYAPDALQVKQNLPALLATGAELKNTFCLTRDHYIFLSHHIGDMENLETAQSFEEGISHFERLFRVQPQAIACDLHPDYLATRYARQRAEEANLPFLQVQHHHAHLAACLADNGWDSPDPLIGLIYDGTGYGTDGTIWGGEVLLGGYRGFQRLFHLAEVPLPGGDASVRKVSRMALAHLWQAGLPWTADLPPMHNLSPREQSILKSQLERRINAPLTTSMGRLFDAAAALIGVRQFATYEGQAAIELETQADPSETGSYPFEISGKTFNPAPVWQALLKDMHSGLSIPRLAARFHNSVVEVNLALCERVRGISGVNTVVLSGGVWQNRILLEKSFHLLTRSGFTVLRHHQIPTNDGGIAVGQAVVAASALQ